MFKQKFSVGFQELLFFDFCCFAAVQATLKAPCICPATTPLSDKDVFDFPFLKDVKTIEYIKNHGKICFLVRGPAKTKKFNLVTLLSGLYSTQSLSPSNYFDEPLLYNVNNLKGWVLNKQANHWCLYNVKTLMEANTPCIIVSTTSCYEGQVDSYMDQILKNGYTPIIAETTRKIEPPVNLPTISIKFFFLLIPSTRGTGYDNHAISLSRNTVVERVTDMARNLNDQIKEKSSCFEAFSIACDETCDTDFNIFEELLELVPMHGTTTGEDIFNCVYDLLQKYNLPQSKLTSVATDEAPSMTGKTNGFVALLRKKLSAISDGSNIHHTHCIIHQEVLCTKVIKMENVLTPIKKFINFIRSRGLNQRQFSLFLTELESEYSGLSYYTEVRWLSCSKVLKQFWDLKEEICQFLITKNQDITLFSDQVWLQDFSFIVDITKHLSDLNLKLQGKDQIITNMCDQVNAFKCKLVFWEKQLKNEDLMHFPTCNMYKSSLGETASYQKYAEKNLSLRNEFETRLENGISRRQKSTFSTSAFLRSSMKSKSRQSSSGHMHVYGKGVIGERAAQKWFEKFKNDDLDLEDMPRSGRPSEFDEEHLKALLKEDGRQKIPDTPKPRIKQDLHPQKAMICVFLGLRRKKPDRQGQIILLHDNARPHVAQVVKATLQELKWEVLQPSPYSPDLAPTDYHHFLSMSNHMRGATFDDEEDLKTCLNNFFDGRFLAERHQQTSRTLGAEWKDHYLLDLQNTGRRGSRRIQIIDMISPKLESFNKKKGREETELEPYVPWYYGWFLNPKDSHLITKLGMEAAAELAPHVWQDLELPSADADIASIYIPEPYIFAMCRYCFGSKSQVGTRYYCSHESLIMVKMERTLEQRYVIKFCFKLQKTMKKMFDLLTQASKDDCLPYWQVKKWHKSFKEPLFVPGVYQHRKWKIMSLVSMLMDAQNEQRFLERLVPLFDLPVRQAIILESLSEKIRCYHCCLLEFDAKFYSIACSKVLSILTMMGLCEEVTKHLGKVSRLKVQYFLIDKLHIWGMVELEQAQWEAMEHLQHLETDEADGVKELKHLDCVVKYPNVPTPSSSLTVKFISCKTTSQIKLTKMIIASTKKAKFPYKESIRSSDDVGMFPQGHSNELKFTGKRGKYYHLKRASSDEDLSSSFSPIFITARPYLFDQIESKFKLEWKWGNS
ncbi:hypothetical protein LAZ67_4003005 [Cordylochernes scorpioides]|uniref:Uncharacterized protein n=1 Tax=Cordylochernes scorpioides TaxID=51811 RepID=A0ABY6KGA9_9ARAC|nr:hypothetical protein LAZ67_4003005 [Cordylochernes scorpioides]